ncbi:hypothetical protein Flav3CDRAFT_1359 [Flavobacteria bacterium MS024-3C]|nr:hypothetical protein Flav3CDRAFT_1359 [Flavobacteria bacterium MS024-3C]
MPFNTETAKAAGKRSKRGPSKVLDPNIKEKVEILYESVFGLFNNTPKRSFNVRKG